MTVFQGAMTDTGRDVVGGRHSQVCGGGRICVEQDDTGALFVHCYGHDFDKPSSSGTLPGALGLLSAHMVRYARS